MPSWLLIAAAFGAGALAAAVWWRLARSRLRSRKERGAPRDELDDTFFDEDDDAALDDEESDRLPAPAPAPKPGYHEAPPAAPPAPAPMSPPPGSPRPKRRPKPRAPRSPVPPPPSAASPPPAPRSPGAKAPAPRSPAPKPGGSGPQRYANVKIRDAKGSRPVVAPLGSVVTVDVAIGVLQRDSDVKDPVPVPENLLPREDLWLVVLFGSPDLAVGRTEEEVGRSTAVEARLLLPSDGSPARTEDGADFLRFYLALPARGGRARARLTYLYRNVAIQSQRIDVTAVEGANNWAAIRIEVTPDFTLSESLGHDLAVLEPRDRVTVVMNESGADQHHFTVRAASNSGTVLAPPAAIAIRGPALGRRVRDLREAMSDTAPTARQRRKAQIAGDLRALAPLGWELYASLPREVQDAMRAARARGGDSVVEVVLPRGVSFTLPWNLVYDIYLDSSAPANMIPVCPLVAEWDPARPLLEGQPRECPRSNDVPHTEHLLCPFGFWGFRHSFEVLTSTDRPKHTVAMRDPCRIVVAQTQRNIDSKRVAKHVERLGALFGAALPGVRLIEARTKAEIRQEIEPDLPFLYFICHGTKDDGQAATLLGVGNGESISPADINGWIDVALTRQRRVWDDPQPLVFINACESLAITPDDIVDYLDAFVGKGHAAGVIGTEVRVDQQLAMEVAETFFRRFLAENTTLDAALRRTKLEFLASGNLVGLNYTAYALADLRILIAA